MRSLYIFAALAVVLTLAGTQLTAGADEVPDTPTPEPIPEATTNRLIVKYTEEAEQTQKLGPASANRMQTMSAAAGIELVYLREMSGDAHVLQVDEFLPVSHVEEIARSLETQPDVEYAEPDYILKPVLNPTDPYYFTQWGYFGTYGIDAPLAWDYTTGTSDIKIAVIDTGITDHADLSGRWVGGYDFIVDTDISNDGNGRDSDPHDPGDWITAAEAASSTYFGCPVDDSSWHGTHVAGTIGAAGNNGVGVVGVNWNSLIVPVRVLGKCGGYISDISDGIRWAAGLTVNGVPSNPHSARVLNLSLGGEGTCGTTLQNAISAVKTAGSVVVVSAGNENTDAANSQPANCNGVITVAATTSSGNKASFSNFGSTVEISAPGNSIMSTINTGATSPVSDSYAYYSGPSMAAPHVAGVVSLLLSLNPSLPPDDILDILQDTAKPFPAGGSCTTSNCGSGIVDAGSAVSWVAALLQYPDLIVTNVVIDPPAPDPDEPFDVIITIKNQGASTGPATIYRDVYIDTDPVSTIDPLTGCPDPGDYYRSDDFTDLATGETDTKTITITDGLSDGQHQIWVYVDSRCLLQETGESNNGP